MMPNRAKCGCMYVTEYGASVYSLVSTPPGSPPHGEDYSDHSTETKAHKETMPQAGYNPTQYILPRGES